MILLSLAAGLVFGLGLIVSAMVDPAKVLGFLDIAGNWDPSLALVMGGAILVTAPAFALARRMGAPVLAPRFEWPTRRDIDARLIGGAALFGIGWGLVGLCPGPALSALGFVPGEVLVFVAAMLAGMGLFHLVGTPRAKAPETGRALAGEASVDA
jgi:uncharacterized membrane protein YedE/YeeE